MKSNEETLDDLLKSMEDFDINMNMEDDSSMEILNEIYDAPYGDSTVGEGGEESKPLSALEKLMAEMQGEAKQSEETVEDIQEEVLTEENIENLLETARSTAQEPADDMADYELQEDINMAEIEALLNMSDNNEIVDEGGFSSVQEQAIFITDTEDEAEEQVLELDPAELDALLSKDLQPEPVDKAVPEKKTENSQAKEKKKKEKVKKEKSEGIFKKLFKILMEEIPDEEPAEASSLNLSEENKDILNELDKEKGKKKKKKDKKDKKAKKEEANQKENEGKPKKEKKVKPKKEKKPKKENEPEKPEKKLPKKKVIVTFVFAFSILAAILLVEIFLPPILSNKVASSAFDQGDYKTAYQEYYGKKLSEEDDLRFQGAKTILRMQSSLDGYYNYIAINKNIMALHSLLEGVHLKSDIFSDAEAYKVTGQVDKVYQDILTLLNSEYNLTEEEAVQLTEMESDVRYTQELTVIVNGDAFEAEMTDTQQMSEETPEVTESVQEEIIEESKQEDLLPEEIELIKGEE